MCEEDDLMENSKLAASMAERLHFPHIMKGEEDSTTSMLQIDYTHPIPPHYTHIGQEDASIVQCYDPNVINFPSGSYDVLADDFNHQLQLEQASNSTLPFSGVGSSQMIATPCSEDVYHLLNMSSSLAHVPPFLEPQLSSEIPVSYDQVYQPPFFRDLLQSLHVPAPYFPSSGVFGDAGDANREGVMGCLFQEGSESSAVPQKFEGGVFEFSREIGKGRRGGRKIMKPYTTERERRVNMNVRFEALKGLVPNPSKADRASIVADAIEYIKELLRTVEELKLVVEKKRRRCGRTGRNKRHRTEGEGKENEESSGEQEDPTAVRTSWLQRKSKDTEVDVRVVDDEVTIKLVWRKKVTCLLLFISRALDELHLDLHHVAGGHIGDHCCFLFNTKIYEGSSVYASAIANKLITVVDSHFPALTCY